MTIESTGPTINISVFVVLIRCVVSANLEVTLVLLFLSQILIFHLKISNA